MARYLNGIFSRGAGGELDLDELDLRPGFRSGSEIDDFLP
jgi:hypothetical protein